jgi:dTDP-glucose 4,6-dehydratase
MVSVKNMKTMIVTGGAGFIGCNFVRMVLAKTDWMVVVFDRLTYAGNILNLRGVEGNPRFAFVLGDIGDIAALNLLLNQWQPEAIVNFAAQTHVDRSIDGPREFLETNVIGTFQLLEAARQFWSERDSRNRFRFLHVSTDEVYGTLGDRGKFTENTPYAPNSPYAASKASSDHFVHAYHATYGLPTLITNSSNNYGRYQFPEKLIPLTILRAVSGNRLAIYGDGRNVRDWLYVDDHCDGILAVLERGRVGQRYNVGGCGEKTNLGIVEEVCTVLEDLLPASRNPCLVAEGIASYSDLKTFVPDRPGHDFRYAVDFSRMARELQWQPRVNLAQGLRLTTSWYLLNREWCDNVQSGNYSGERLGLQLGAIGR